MLVLGLPLAGFAGVQAVDGLAAALGKGSGIPGGPETDPDLRLLIAAIFGVFALAGAAMIAGGAWLVRRSRRPG